MNGFFIDLRAAVRSFYKAPSFVIVTILTLAVAIGANTAIFSVVNAVLLQPLPYPEPDRLVRVFIRLQPGVTADNELSFSDRGYWHFFENNRVFSQFGGHEPPQQWPLTGEGPPIQVDVARMTTSAFESLDVGPQRGRFPTAEEDAPGGPQLALISYGLWSSVFGSDPAILGETIELNGQSREVIGVMPAGYDFPSPDTDVWVPDQLNPASENFGGHHIFSIARLAPGETIESATLEAERLIAGFGEIGYGPNWFASVLTGEAIVRPLKEEIVGDARRPLLILLGTMGFVLLIGCTNVASLFQERAQARTVDTAVRVALGSGSGRLVRLVLTEGILLGLIGGALGVFLAYLGVRLVVSAGPASIPRLGDIGINTTVLAFTAAISILSGMLFALLPALRTRARTMLDALRGGRSGPLGVERHRIRNVLVALEVALALVLFVGSVLMVRSFGALNAIDPGFDRAGVLTFRLSPSPARHESPEDVARFYDQLIESLNALPGVEATGAITQLPLTGDGAVLLTRVEEFPPPEGELPPAFRFRRTAPGYFEALGIPVVEGRTFTNDDHQRRLGSAIISQSIKEQYWPDTSALGKRLNVSGAPGQVVGVVGDVRDMGLDLPAGDFVYYPMLDEEEGGVRPMVVTMRTARDPLGMLPEVRNVVASLDPELPVTDIRSMESVVGDSLSRTSFTMIVLSVAAGIALFLGAVGVYGVISYGVRQRTGEIGVRQALGAEPGMVRRLILRDGLRVGVTGVVIGIVASLALGRVLASLLYGVSPYDTVTLIAGSVVFLGVAALASAIPAARAARIPPVVAIQSE